jgi:hypothetical protein
MLIWFSMPFSRQVQVEVADTDMFYRPQDYALRAVTLVAGRLKADRTFSGERFLRDLRFGLPQVPTLGSSFYISSAPTGLKVFIEPGGGSPQAFLLRIEDRLYNPEKDVPPSEQGEARYEKGRTPLRLEAAGDSALVALVMESIPPELTQVSGDEPDRLFASDGDLGYANETNGDRKLYVKIYQVTKTGAVGSVIGLFQPRDMTRNAETFQNFWPAKVCFPFNDGLVEKQLRENGVTQEVGPLLAQLHYCGKAIFTGSEGKTYALELSAPEQPGRVFEVQPAKNLKAKPETTGPH